MYPMYAIYTFPGLIKVKRFFSVVSSILAEFTLNISRDINDTKILIWYQFYWQIILTPKREAVLQ